MINDKILVLWVWITNGSVCILIDIIFICFLNKPHKYSICTVVWTNFKRFVTKEIDSGNFSHHWHITFIYKRSSEIRFWEKSATRARFIKRRNEILSVFQEFKRLETTATRKTSGSATFQLFSEVKLILRVSTVNWVTVGFYLPVPLINRWNSHRLENIHIILKHIH